MNGLLAPAFDFAGYQLGAISVCYFAAAAASLMVVALVRAGRAVAAETAARRAFAGNIALVILVLIAEGGRHSAGYPEQAAAFSRLAVAAFALIGPSTLGFVCALIGWRDHVRAARALASIGGGLLAALAVDSPLVIARGEGSPGALRVVGGLLLPLVLFTVVAELVGALALCAARARATASPIERHQLRAVLWAYGVGALGALDVVRLFGVPLPPSSFLWLTLAAIILAHAVRSYHLLDTPELGWRALVWLLASALAVAPVAAVLLLTRGWHGWRSALPATLALEAIFLAVAAYGRRVQPRIDAFFLRRRRDLARDLDRLAESLLVVRTTEALRAELSRVLHASLYVKADLLDEAPPFLAGRREPLLREEVVALPLPATREAAARAFADSGAAVLVPLAVPELVGAIAVGPRRDGAAFVPPEIDFLRRLGPSVASSLAAARGFDRRHELRDALEDKVRARAAELARAREGLLRAQDKIVQREKMATLGLVVGGVASDLETAVAAVAGAVPALQRDVAVCEAAAARAVAALSPADPWTAAAQLDHLRDDIYPLVAAIAEGARRARAIAADLSLFARPSEAGFIPIDLGAEVDAALRLLAPELGDRITVVRDLPADLPPVTGDPGAIGQILLNLLTNAAQAIDGPGTIRVRGRSLGDRLELGVADTGKGIPPEHLRHLFEPFFTTKVGGRSGSGLGLFVSYGITQRHGGELLVSSEVGKGSEFRLVLPVGPVLLLQAAPAVAERSH